MKLPSGFRHEEFGEVASTNDEAARLVREGARPYVLVTAARQTGGRGRHGRAWASEKGNLFASLIVTAKGDVAQRALYGFVMAAAIGEALTKFLTYKNPPRLKWPNDVRVDGKKIAGVLLEIAQGPGGEELIIGFGVNCKSHPQIPDFPATSLAAEGAEASPEDVLNGVLRNFLEMDELFGERGFADIRERWLALAEGLGKPVRLSFGGRDIEGLFTGLGLDDGAMILKKPDGAVERLRAGEAHFPASEKDVGAAAKKA